MNVRILFIHEENLDVLIIERFSENLSKKFLSVGCRTDCVHSRELATCRTHSRIQELQKLVTICVREKEGGRRKGRKLREVSVEEGHMTPLQQDHRRLSVASITSSPQP